MPLTASTNAATSAVTPKKPRVGAPPPPPPPPPPPAALRAQQGSQVVKAAPPAQVSGAPPGVPTVRDLAGGLAALRKVQAQQQSSPVAPAAPPPQPVVPPKAAGTLVVHPEELARARAALRKTKAASAQASPAKPAASPARGTPAAKKQATPSPKAAPASRNATPSRAARVLGSPRGGAPAAAHAEEPPAGGAPDFTFARSPVVMPAPPSPARVPHGGSARKAPVVGWMPFAGQPLVESPIAGGDVSMTERLAVEGAGVEEEQEAVPVPDATEMLVDSPNPAAAPTAAPGVKRRSSVAFAPLPAVSPRAAPSASMPRRRSTPFRVRPVDAEHAASMDASPVPMQLATAAASPTMLGLAPWMMEAGLPQEQVEREATAPVAAPTITPLRARRQSMRATGDNQTEGAAVPSPAAADPDALVHMAAELLAVRAELLRAKKALRVSKRQALALKRALKGATAASVAAPSGAMAASQAPAVVVLRPSAEPVDVTARPQGAVQAGKVVVVYTEHAPVAPMGPTADLAAAAEPVAMAVDDAVVAPVADAPAVAAPPPASHAAPSCMFQSPKKAAPQEGCAAANEPTSLLPGWLFAGDTALNVTPRSGTRRKSMAARAVGATPVRPENDESSMPPLVLSFEANGEAEPMEAAEVMPAAPAEPAPEESAAVDVVVVEAAAPQDEPVEALPVMPSPAPAPAPTATTPEAVAVEAPARLEASAGAALVGARVVVWWPLDKAWYAGAVSSYAARGKKHTVVYDDGQKEAVSLAAVIVRDAALHEAAIAAGLPVSPEEEQPADEAAPVAAPSAKKAVKKAASKRARPAEPVAAAQEAEPAPKRVTRARRA
jgi:hypothetical protein